jgi:protein-S-isoprenylcysteine O-methyltransferase Ste14
MAQSSRKRRRKHRGTQAGTIETPAHRSGKSTKAAATSTRAQRTQRMVRPPTWKSAGYKAAAAALVFGLLSATLFHSKGGPGTIVITVFFVFFLYLPIAYWTDKAMYKRRQAKAQAGK